MISMSTRNVKLLGGILQIMVVFLWTLNPHLYAGKYQYVIVTNMIIWLQFTAFCKWIIWEVLLLDLHMSVRRKENLTRYPPFLRIWKYTKLYLIDLLDFFFFFFTVKLILLDFIKRPTSSFLISAHRNWQCGPNLPWFRVKYLTLVSFQFISVIFFFVCADFF